MFFILVLIQTFVSPRSHAACLSVAFPTMSRVQVLLEDSAHLVLLSLIENVGFVVPIFMPAP